MTIFSAAQKYNSQLFSITYRIKSKGCQNEMTYGIIKNKNGETYVSPIFALKYVGWKSEAIVFNETFKKLNKNLGFRILRNS